MFFFTDFCFVDSHPGGEGPNRDREREGKKKRKREREGERERERGTQGATQIRHPLQTKRLLGSL